MLQIIVSVDAPLGLAQSVKEALACYLDLFGSARVVEVHEIVPQQLRLQPRNPVQKAARQPKDLR